MATLSAPYNNAMRLGQGFNSHTQKICIDNAVIMDVGQRKPPMSAAETPEAQKQNVTYTARFVDKLSDIVEATNLSPSFAIKSGTIGSPGKGSFIDTDQFKESDINFLIHVKVTRQTVVQQENIRFQRLKGLPTEKFHDIFGDTFISGFLEGGDFTALISLKVVERKRKEEVKAQAKLALTSPTASPDVERAAYAARMSLQENTEIAISVSWTGGGELKEEGALWNIETIAKTAARFPDLVHRCPQLTTAILTKYTSIRSFHESMSGFTPLDYDNVGVYMSDLLDAYMDYKLLSRQINKMIEEPESYEERDRNEKEMREDLQPINLVLSELDEAKTFCRQQMLRIVKEVDTIGAQPELAISEEHVPPYMSPELFTSLVPKRRCEDLKPGASHTPPLFEGPLHDYKPAEQDHLTINAPLGSSFLLSRRSGSMYGPPITSQLISLPTNAYPRQLDIFDWDGVVRGFSVRYPSTGVLAIGNVMSAGRTPSSMKLAVDERIVSVHSISSLAWGDTRLVTYVSAKTNKGNVLKAGDFNKARHGRDAVVVEAKAPEGGGLKGFYGSFGDAVDSLGVIWGRVVEESGDDN